MSKVHIDDQIVEAKRLVSKEWPSIQGEQRTVAKAIVTTLEWVRDNADAIRLAARASKEDDVLRAMEAALEAKKVFPGAEVSLREPGEDG